MPITLCILSLAKKAGDCGERRRVVLLCQVGPMCAVLPLHLDDLCSRYVHHIVERTPSTPQMTSWPSAQWTTG